MKKTSFCYIAVLLAFCWGTQKCVGANGFALVKDRKPAASLLVTKEQTKSSQYLNSFGRYHPLVPLSSVIKDFNEDLKECAGVELPVINTDDGKTPVIRLALESRTRQDEDRFSVTFPDMRTMLITGSEFGVRWALNHILEKFAGVRYLSRSKNFTHFPKISDLIIPRLEITMEPSFNLHRTSTGWVNYYWFGRAYNKRTVPMGEELISVPFPIKKYMKENKWPDFIFPIYKGKKFLPYKSPHYKKASHYNSGWQPCYSNQPTIDEAVKNICDYFARKPKISAISLGINDGGGFCQCDNCRKIGGSKRNIIGKLNCSEVYYQWLNKVVEAITKKYPDKLFGCLAYREVLTPPSFKLHKNIVPYICIDGNACIDPKVKANRINLFKEWKKKASNTGWYDYSCHAAPIFDVPMVCFRLQRDMLKIAHDNNVRAVTTETGGSLEDGPKKYLYGKLLWDVNLDLDMLLKDWYEACVGKEAAPYLSEYFKLWENFFREDAVKTAWFKGSKNATYLSMASKSYLYAVDHKDMLKMRTLMEKVIELADKHGDKRQRLRAGYLMREFEYSEACVYASGGHIFPYSSSMKNTEQVVAYLNFLPEAIKYDSRRVKLFMERQADPETSTNVKAKKRPRGSYVSKVLSNIVNTCLDKPKVREAFKNVEQNPNLPSETRRLLEFFAKRANQEPLNNLLKDGSFENGNLDAWENGQITSKKAFLGKKSLMVNLSTSTGAKTKSVVPAKPGTCLMSVRIYLKQKYPNISSYVKLVGYAQKRGENWQEWITPKIDIKSGKWNIVSLIADVKPDMETVKLSSILFRGFRKGDVAYIDDIIITPLDNKK